ncbi:hypothetical protein PV04_00342 [Phialophora macrospora]|uniref:Zn(2)-C6 fungal-type domain-containing protein n=1 Tax=Phialophora macrospora TaxID=1851006 RepID=A0A0D2ECX3_9EURO|nr:hypothetical protein PV04_00342 [Phialophora macrospora]
MSPPAPAPPSARPPVEETSEPQPKRRRIPIACNACRNRKSRCDGAQPTCAMCKDTGNECIYLRPLTRQITEESQPYRDLERRLQALEELIHSSHTSGLVKEVSSGEDATRRRPALSSPSTSTTHMGEPDDTNAPEESRSLAFAVDPIDGMGAVLLEPEERSTFHGPSSNITFTRCITQTIARVGNIVYPWNSGNDQGVPLGYVNITHSPGSTNTVAHGKGSQRAKEFDKFAVPPEGLAGELIQHYFSDAGSHSLFPFLHRQSFMEQYAHMRKYGARSMRRTWLGLFNMVLAVATNMVDRDDLLSSVRISEAQNYYERAVSLCDRYVLNGSSLELVQYLVSQTQYLQATHKSIQTSVAHSMAVNAAIRIGLHSRQASQACLPLEREMRKRTWFMCMVFDRVLSMTLGQPPVIPNSSMTLDLPAHFAPDTLGGRGVESHTDYSLGLFVATIKLYRILGKVIEQQYSQNLALEASPELLDIVAPIPSIDNELREWEQDLPTDLKTISSRELQTMLSCLVTNGPTLIAKRFKVHLTLRALNVRLLLHRPVLVKYLEASHCSNIPAADIAVLNRLGSHSIYMCFRTAVEIIDIVSTLVQERRAARRFLNAWWFTLYYITNPMIKAFNAALVAFGVMMICQDPARVIADAPSKEACKDGLNKAVQALAKLDRGNKMVERCHDYLERLIVATTALTSAADSIDLSGFDPLPNGVTRLANGSETFSAQTFLDGRANFERNVGDIMTGDDLGFLDLYFPPEAGMSSTLGNTDFAPAMDYQS